MTRWQNFVAASRCLELGNAYIEPTCTYIQLVHIHTYYEYIFKYMFGCGRGVVNLWCAVFGGNFRGHNAHYAHRNNDVDEM